MRGWPLFVSHHLRIPRKSSIGYLLKKLLIIAMKIQIWHGNHVGTGVTEMRQRAQLSLLEWVLRGEVSRLISLQRNEGELENMAQ